MNGLSPSTKLIDAYFLGHVQNKLFIGASSRSLGAMPLIFFFQYLFLIHAISWI